MVGRARWVVAGLLVSMVPIAGCTEDISAGAVWRYVWLSSGGSPLQIAGAECLNIRKGTSHSIEGTAEFDYAAFYSLSEKGVLREDMYIVPENPPANFDLTVQNGELVGTSELTRDSFATNELLQDDVPTHTGETVTVVRWFEEECSENPSPPPGFDPPMP